MIKFVVRYEIRLRGKFIVVNSLTKSEKTKVKKKEKNSRLLSCLDIGFSSEVIFSL